jgi:hypothetical protein
MPTVEKSGAGLWRRPRAIDGHLILDEEEVFAVYEAFSSLNPVTADSRDCEAAVRRFQVGLESLRSGERVQIIVDCGPYDPAEDLGKMRAQISEEAAPGFRSFYPEHLERYLKAYCVSNRVPVFRYYVIFGYSPPKAPGESGLTPLKTALNEVRRRSGDFVRLMASNRLECRLLRQDRIVDLLDSMVNPSRLTPLAPEDLAEGFGATGAEAGPEELLFRSPVVHSVPEADVRHSYIQVGRRLVKTIGFLRAPLPDARLKTALAELMLSQREFRFSFFVEGLSQERATQLIQKKRAAALGAVTFGEGRETQAPEEQALQYDELLRAHARKELRFVNWSAYLSVFSDNEADLHQAASDLAGSFRDLVPDEGILRQIPYWQSTLPLCADAAGNRLMAQSNAVASLFPFFEFRSTSPEGGALLGFSPANQPCFFDPWSKVVSNGNVFVTGQAGSGKSYLINLIINRLGPRAFDVSFIDRAKSYRSTCLALGGDYVEFGLDGVHAVNVWDVMEHDPELEESALNDLDRHGRVLADKVEQVAGCIEIILAENGGELPKLEKAILLDDVADTFRRCLLFWEDVEAEREARRLGKAPKEPHSRTHLLIQSIPLFTDLADTLKGKIGDEALDFRQERKELLQKLQPAIEGNLSGLLNRRTTLTAGAKARVFDISNLPDQPTILGAAVFVLTAWLYRHWRRNKTLNRRQIVVFDEIYAFMGFESGRRLLDALARRSRHMGLMPFFATQQLSDVLSFKETRGILDNCQTQFLFSQARNVVDRITDILHLSDQERGHLENLSQVRGVYSSAFFVYGAQRNILTIRPDPVTRWLNTSEPTYDVPRMKQALAASGGDIWEAVRGLMAAEGGLQA